MVKVCRSYETPQFCWIASVSRCSVSHRSHGSTGNSQDPGKVWKGKKMAGHMGDARVTIQNLMVVSTDLEKGIILLKGAVPGAKGSYVLIKDAVKDDVPDEAPFPASIKTQSLEDTADNLTMEVLYPGRNIRVVR